MSIGWTHWNFNNGEQIFTHSHRTGMETHWGSPETSGFPGLNITQAKQSIASQDLLPRPSHRLPSMTARERYSVPFDRPYVASDWQEYNIKIITMGYTVISNSMY